MPAAHSSIINVKRTFDLRPPWWKSSEKCRRRQIHGSGRTLRPGIYGMADARAHDERAVMPTPVLQAALRRSLVCGWGHAQECGAEYTRCRLRAYNPEYRKVKWAIGQARKKGDRAQVRSPYKRLHGRPSQDPSDPDYRRLRYCRCAHCRYADDTLFGFAGPKAEAEEIKARLAEFLRYELKLELSSTKTLITHARSHRARFLGYEIRVAASDRRTRCPSPSDRRNRRSLNGTIALHVPASVIKAKSAPYLSGGKPAPPNHDGQRV